MNRKASLSTLISLIVTSLLVLGLVGWLVFIGGTVFSPGPVTARAAADKPDIKGFKNHAEFENQCNLCHQPLQNDQATLCLDCHKNVDTEIQKNQGLHAKIADVRKCFNCHPDHKGRDFSPLQAGAARFDHTQTKFSLVRHQVNYNAAPLECVDCHQGMQKDIFIAEDTSCINCHAEKDKSFMTAHVDNYGTNCLFCHDGSDHFADFEHAKSKFPLTGTHATIACEKCHLDNNHQPRFQNISKDCTSCHTEPTIHQGNFKGQSCDSCHNTTSWKPAKIDGKDFEHFTQTGFTLAKHSKNYDQTDMTCVNCHGSDIHNKTAAKCLECHQSASPDFMAKHVNQFGNNCSGCHDGVDRYKNFNHAQFFILDGAHIGVDCTKCHGADVSTAVYKGLGSACITCHQEPDIHKGFFGLACQNCHTTSAWRPAMLKLHDFPLDHGGVDLQCKTCHPDSYTTYTCYTCHDHIQAEIEASHVKANIAKDQLVYCFKCHPTGKHQDWITP